MPGIEDWLNCPLDIVQRIFEEDNVDWTKDAAGYFVNKLKEKKTLSWVPSLNDAELHNLKANSLVKFRCMVQDMFDPEFYLGIYEVEDRKTGQKTLRTGRYRDIAECLPHQQINIESSRNVTLDRQTLYCVPVPGETQWVKQAFSSESQAKVTPSTSYTAFRQKRSLETDENESNMESDSNAVPFDKEDRVAMETESQSSDNKRSRTEEECSASGTITPNLNFPLPGEKGPACLVKVYENFDQFRVNDVIEFIGVLSVDPALATINHHQEVHTLVDPSEEMEDIEERHAHSPPPSLVPRLHAIVVNKLHHCNPLLPQNIESEETQTVFSDALSVRQDLIAMFQQVLFGDSLAAEYLLLHLVSSVYTRRDVLALGKFSLNLTNSPASSAFPQQLYKLLEELLAKCHFLQLSLENMNTLKFIPRKDYTANRLCSGLLQLSERTHLVVDETALQPGQLDTNGVQNMAALGNVISWQKVDYDFNFHRAEFPTNIKVLTLSEGKSILPSDCQVPIKSANVATPVEEVFATVYRSLTSVLMSKFRSYLGLVELLDYNLTEDLQKAVEEDFVEMRKNDPQSMTADDFHLLLVVSRWLSLTLGQKTLSKETWTKAKMMERERKRRLKN
ncbi:mini-chromosome maintenance complex-binding protein-like [Ptychodera flava]|uniref:mini-chromosome maintenance complex-binding protein-like n=1 Tax=Ptychodera flava TaxID=63121 RepID=UPI00396A293B